MNSVDDQHLEATENLVNKCPFCEGGKLEHLEISATKDEVWRTLRCENCGNTYELVYDLRGLYNKSTGDFVKDKKEILGGDLS